jgi:hypothetical protein
MIPFSCFSFYFFSYCANEISDQGYRIICFFRSKGICYPERRNRNVSMIFIYIFFFTFTIEKENSKTEKGERNKSIFRPIRSYRLKNIVVVGRVVFRMIDHVFQH